jgi:cytochrome b561
MNTNASVDRPKTHYRAGPALLHWLTAALLLVSVPLGAIMVDLPRVQTTFVYYSVHKWIGVTVFLLCCVRLVLRRRHPPPPLPESMPFWQRRASRTVHVLLYALLLSLPLVGWMAGTAGGFSIVLFNVLPLPAPVPKSKELNELLVGVHSVLAWSLVALAALHVLAVLKHQFIDDDRLLARMVDGLRRD